MACHFNIDLVPYVVGRGTVHPLCMDEFCLGSLAGQVSETIRAPADAVTLRRAPRGAN